MRLLRSSLIASFALTTVCLLSGFCARHAVRADRSIDSPDIVRQIAILKSGDAQHKAAAAYWLGRQHSTASGVVNLLAGLLGNTTQVDPAQYRQGQGRLSLGEEAAAALVQIGAPATDKLIEVLTSSPQPHARENAAWALGAIHDLHSTSSQPSKEKPPGVNRVSNRYSNKS